MTYDNTATFSGISQPHNPDMEVIAADADMIMSFVNQGRKLISSLFVCTRTCSYVYVYAYTYIHVHVDIIALQ